MQSGQPGSVGHMSVSVCEQGSLLLVPIRTAFSSGLRSFTSLSAWRILPSTVNSSRLYLWDIQRQVMRYSGATQTGLGHIFQNKTWTGYIKIHDINWIDSQMVDSSPFCCVLQKSLHFWEWRDNTNIQDFHLFFSIWISAESDRKRKKGHFLKR